MRGASTHLIPTLHQPRSQHGGGGAQVATWGRREKARRRLDVARNILAAWSLNTSCSATRGRTKTPLQVRYLQTAAETWKKARHDWSGADPRRSSQPQAAAAARSGRRRTGGIQIPEPRWRARW
jgi:hypothetical protein